VQQFHEKLRALYEVNIELSNSSSFDVFCRQAVELGRTRLGFDRLGLWFLDETGEMAVGTYGTDAQGQTIAEHHITQRAADVYPPHAFRAQRSLTHFHEGELTDSLNQMQGRGWNALAALWHGDKVLGFLSADNLLRHEPAQPEQLELLMLYATTLGHLAIRIQTEDHLRQRTQEEQIFQQRLRALHEINVALTQAETFEELCREAVVRGRSQLGFDRMSLWFTDRSDARYLHGSYGTDEQGQLRSEWQYRYGVGQEEPNLANQVLSGQVSALVNHDVPLYDASNQPVGVGWVAVAGLNDGEQVIGCLFADNLLNQPPLGRYQLEVLRLYGATLGHLAKRKWDEEALRHSEARYRAIFTGAGLGICVTDAQGQIVSSNPQFRKLLGYSTAELHKTSIVDLTHPEERAATRGRFEALVRGEITGYQYEKRYLRHDGTSVWVRLHVSPFPGPTADDVSVIAMIEDISKHREDAERLRHSEAHQRALLQAIPDLIFLLNRDGVFVDYNQKSTDRLYVPPQHFLGRHFAAVLPPDVSEKMQPAFDRLIATGAMQRYEYPLTVGERTDYFESRIVPYDDQHILAVVREVTEQRNAELQLRESEARFRQIAEHVDEVFFVQDAQTQQMLYVNPAYNKIWQQPAAELYADPLAFMQSIHPDDLPGVQRDVNVEYRIVRPDGQTRWLWTQTFPIKNDQGEPYRVAWVTKDITQRKEIEDQNLNVALQQERIRILSDFIRDASHEFRTPLSIINSKVYLASRVDDPAVRAAHHQSILVQSANILKLVESLVAMTRLDSQIDFLTRPLDLNDLLRALYAHREAALAERQVNLRLDIAHDLPQVLGDVDELYTAVDQLLENASVHTSAGGSITLRSFLVDATHVAVSVNDTGAGIAAEELPFIFDRFYRGDKAHSTPGFGLGLPIARKIVEGHAGQIDVISEMGQGTSFIITLPVKLPPAP
jgi:PAS domain S-box-containing protein